MATSAGYRAKIYTSEQEAQQKTALGAAMPEIECAVLLTTTGDGRPIQYAQAVGNGFMTRRALILTGLTEWPCRHREWL